MSPTISYLPSPMYLSSAGLEVARVSPPRNSTEASGSALPSALAAPPSIRRTRSASSCSRRSRSSHARSSAVFIRSVALPRASNVSSLTSRSYESCFFLGAASILASARREASPISILKCSSNWSSSSSILLESSRASFWRSILCIFDFITTSSMISLRVRGRSSASSSPAAAAFGSNPPKFSRPVLAAPSNSPSSSPSSSSLGT
mmetsp:Transcript_26205/g.78751  ORF Transcript_26205/g.78751 Transcript_26205/m.78751 type:complete len:205 (+) Transcript_26205:1779-2393(+)